jgi:alpha-ribazole phosphatase
VILYVLRHAATVAAEGLIGRTDVALAGSQEAAADAAIAALQGVTIERVWSSPLSRCAGTAGQLAARLGIAQGMDERLLEISHGAWEGTSFAELERRDAAAYAAWMRDWEDTGPPGGESARALERRVASWLAELPSAPQLLIAHAGVVRALRVLVLGEAWPAAMRAPVPHLGTAGALACFRR